MDQKFEAYFHLPFALINGLASLQRPGREQEVMNLHTIAQGAHLKCRDPEALSEWNATGALQKLQMTNQAIWFWPEIVQELVVFRS